MIVRKRLMMTLAGFVLLFLWVVGRLFSLQILQGEALTARGVSQWTRSGQIAAQRGDIVDRNGKLLVQSTSAYTVCVNPRQVVDAQGLARVLSQQLGVSEESVLKKVADTSKSSVTIKRQVARETVDTLRALKAGTEERALAGVMFDEDTRRWYPMGAYLAQVLGITNIDSQGQSGLEQYYESYLKGVSGRIVSEVDARARTLAGGEKEYVAAIAGDTLKLTIDKEIQSFVERALRQCVEVNQAKSVQAIVMDVKTGAILAMSMKPDYDPNDPPRNDLDTFRQLMRITTISDVYEPGSTFKILTCASVLDAGLASPEEPFYCSGSITVDGDTIRCWGNPHGAQTLKTGLQNSCNPVFVQLGLRLGTERFYQYLSAFGLGRATGIDLPGESTGILIASNQVKNVDLARIGFGQSVAVTPLQLITAASAVVNGGYLMKPYIVSEVLNSEGQVIERTTPQIVSRPIREETSALMRELLESVVEEGGGKNARIEGYRIGGKTGTAQVYKEGRVVRDVHIGSFFGFAPADDPEFAVLVTVDEARVLPDYGSTTAAPFARQIIEETLAYLGYRPYNAQAKAKTSVPAVTGLSVTQAAAALREAGLSYVSTGEEQTVTSQLPPAGSEVYAGSQVMLYLGAGEPPETDMYVCVPDVTGMTIVNANRTLRARELNLYIEGSGLAVSQSPAAGEYVAPGEQISVVFKAP